MSMSSLADQGFGVGGEQRLVDVGVPVQPAYRDRGQFQRRTDPGGQLGGLLVEQPGHRAAHHAAAEQRDPDRLRRAHRRASTGSAGTVATAVAAQPTSVAMHLVQALSPDDQPRLPAGHRNHRRTGNPVVIAGHCVAVGAGGGHRQQVAGPHVAGQPAVAHHDVAALAMLADHPAALRRRLGWPGWPAPRCSRRRTARSGCCRSSRRPPRRRYVAQPPPSSTIGLTVPTSYSVIIAGPMMARPGSTASRGTASPASAHSRSMIGPQPAGDLGRRLRIVPVDVGDAQPAAEVDLGQLDGRSCRGSRPAGRPPGARRPRSRRCRRSASRCASAGRPVAGWAAASTLATAAASACPLAREKPNFWSSCAVAMNSWVCASTPTVTRTSTSDRAPGRGGDARPAGRSRGGCPARSGRPRPRPPARSSATDLLLPCKAIRSGSTPARSAMASSPAVHTSMPRPSSAMIAATAVHRNALPA